MVSYLCTWIYIHTSWVVKMSEGDYLYPEWADRDVNTPHDWTKYVSDEVRAIWADFSVSQRMALGRCFDEIASREEWE